MVQLIRRGVATTRPELADATHLGRNIISHRIRAGQEVGLVEPDGSGRSRGGRAAEVWRFRHDAGQVLVCVVEKEFLRTLLTDLGGNILSESQVVWSLGSGVDSTLEQVAQEAEKLLKEAGIQKPWGACIAVPTTVDVAEGRMASPVVPIDSPYRWPLDVDIRGWFAQRLGVPVWLASVSKLMPLGALMTPGAPKELVYIRMGSNIMGGLAANGRVCHGAQWMAGSLGHVTVSDEQTRICSCGRYGCLDTVAGGGAMVADAKDAVAQGRSPYLAKATVKHELAVDDISEGAKVGDTVCVEIVVRAATMLGRALSAMIAWGNPARIIIGGSAIAHNELFLTVLRQTIQVSTLASFYENLEIVQGDPEQRELVTGAVGLVVEYLISPPYLAAWGPGGSPADCPEMQS
ncbi:MAG: ROK family transcriptional regulator [Propionibacteriaceae bacterium]|nr:ROK family transcriptional regulator [Propionibacteriaceae bacterium]